MTSTVVDISDAVKALSQIVDEREAKLQEVIAIRLRIKKANQDLMIFQRQMIALEDAEKKIIRQLARDKQIYSLGTYTAEAFL